MNSAVNSVTSCPCRCWGAISPGRKLVLMGGLLGASFCGSLDEEQLESLIDQVSVISVILKCDNVL